MEVEGDPPKSILSPTLESFEAFIGAYVKYIPEKIQVEKRIREIQEYSKNKRVRKDIPKSPEKVLPIEMKLFKEVLAVAKQKKEAKERKRQVQKLQGFLNSRKWPKSRES